MLKVMKPSKLNKTKHPTNGERKNKGKGPKSELKVQKLIVGHKGAKEQSMF
jgi:hypothetical protein